MRKIIMLFILLTSVAFANDFTGKLLTEDLETYVEIKNKSIADIDNPKIQELSSLLLEYEDFYNITLSDYFSGGEYCISEYAKPDKEVFFAIRKMTLSEYTSSSFYNNTAFFREYIDDLSISYIIGEKQLIYAFDNDYLYVGNDLTYFFRILGNSDNKSEMLESDYNFIQFSNYNESYDLMYYTVKDGTKESYFEAENSSATFREDTYSLADTQEKLYNFSEYAIADPDRIYVGNSPKIFIEYLKADFEYLEEYNFDDLSLFLENNMEYGLYMEKSDKDYFVIFNSNGWNDLESNIIKAYSDAYFYNKKLDLQIADFGKYFELPYLGIKKYMTVKNQNYFIISEDYEVIKEIVSKNNLETEYTALSPRTEKFIDNTIGAELIKEIRNGIVIEKTNFAN